MIKKYIFTLIADNNLKYETIEAIDEIEAKLKFIDILIECGYVTVEDIEFKDLFSKIKSIAEHDNKG